MSFVSGEESQEALEMIHAANLEMAARAKAPVWYHWALGGLTGGLIAVRELPQIWSSLYFIPYFLGLAVLVAAYRRKTGMWVSGYRAGRTRWVALAAWVMVIGLYLGSMALANETGWRGVYVVAGLVAALVVTAAGYFWEAAFRRDLGVGGA